MSLARCEPKVLRPALGIESRFYGDGFQQRRFAHAVLAHDERHRAAEPQPAEPRQRGHRIGVFVRQISGLFQSDIFDIECVFG